MKFMADKINGIVYASQMRAKIKARIKDYMPKPHMAVVLVGDDAASQVYIRNKQKACAEVGIHSTLHTLPAIASQQEILNLINTLNNDATVNGILVQQPFPRGIDKNTIVSAVDPKKDVDCLHPYNLGLVAIGQAQFLPCTPGGIIELLKQESIDISGKHAVIIGRSDIVGKPLAFMLLNENVTVTICHSKTQNLAQVCSQADILIAAVGKAKLITADFVKSGAVVIDVGINRENGKLCGDVDYDNVFEKVSHITPVPGGVGPMTVAMLLENCVSAWQQQRNENHIAPSFGAECGGKNV